MTVKQLIAKLNKMPQNLQVGIAAGDNSPWEIAMYPVNVVVMDKAGVVLPEYVNAADRECFDTLPKRTVVIRC